MTDKNPACRSVIIGLAAGIVITGLLGPFSQAWRDISSYNQSFIGIESVHIFVSLLLVLFFAGCCIPFMLHTGSRRMILCYSVLAGLIATAISLFPPFPISRIPSFDYILSLWPQIVIFFFCGALVTVCGGQAVSFIRKDEEQGFSPLLPVAIVTVAVIVLPLLLAAASMSTGIIPPTTYPGIPSQQPTELEVLKIPPDEKFDWITVVNITTYDSTYTLTEYPDGYAIAATEYGPEYNSVHLILLDQDGNITRQTEIRTGYGTVSSLIPTADSGYLLATGMPEILRIDHKGETIWTKSLENESLGLAPVSLMARADGSFVAAWDNHTACLTDNGTVLWDTTLDTNDRPEKISISPADAGDILVFTGDPVDVPLSAVRLDADGTVLWEQTIGRGNTDTLLGVWQNESGHMILYRTTKDLWGRDMPTYTSHLITLSDAGTVTELQEVEDTGGDVIPSPVRGYISVDIEKGFSTVTEYDAGREIRTMPYGAVNQHSLKGIGTTDGGYLIAFSQ